MDYNKVFISGIIVKEPEYFVTVNNQAVLKINIQVKDRKITNFFNVIVFGSLGEKFHKVLKKEDKIFVEGRLRYSRYQTKTGIIKSKVDIIADKLHIIKIIDKGGNNGK